MSDNMGEAQEMLKEFNNGSEAIGLAITFGKTKGMSNMVTSKQIQINDNKIGIVDIYIYSGHNQTCKLNKRITLGWTAYEKMKDTLKQTSQST